MEFKEEFLDSYLHLGLGSMSKSDVDALVMHLLDKYGVGKSGALATRSNQEVSQLLKTPTSKVKNLRYAAALKFSDGKIEEQAQARLLMALSKATFEDDGDKICLILEDSLAKNWLQGQLKKSRQVFDHSFNTEIIKVSASGLCNVLKCIFGKKAVAGFEADIKKQEMDKSLVKQASFFKKLALDIAVACGIQGVGGLIG